MLLKDVELFVYKLDNSTFELLGTIDKYSSLIWPDNFIGYDTFELWAPIIPTNRELLKQGNVVWIGEDLAFVIEIINPQNVDTGVRKYFIKGRSLEKLLEDRIIWGTYTNKGLASTVMYDIVNKICINPTNSDRKIPWLELAEDRHLGTNINIQKTGGLLYDFLKDLSEENNLGFKVNFDPRNQKLIFEVVKGKDLTRNNTEGNLAVELSTEFDDILSSEYCSNNQNYKNVAFIQGEEVEGKQRANTIAGDNSTNGFLRKELYVDARDLQSEVFEDNVQKIIPQAEYIEMLKLRGQEKLSERVVEESFSAVVRQFGNVQYEYGTDYNLGDFVTIIDEELKVSINAQVTNVQKEFDSEYNIRLTFGYARPTLLERVKQSLG